MKFPSDDQIFWLIIGSISTVIVFTIGWKVAQWGLCRDEGMSFWYCIQHIL